MMSLDSLRLINADGRLRIWRQAHEAMDPAWKVGTVQGHGGSFMVWGVFSWHCLGSLVHVPTSFNVLVDSMVRRVSRWSTASVYVGLLSARRERPSHNINELWRALTNIWPVIPVERFQKLVESMSRRVAVIIKARRGPTCY
ncbi:uncharacterized protein TNCV_4292541 [Trichonephila clavipes]|uniref:Uncharacterized protein n=1 Tax=Trichonephila clavipes TaxID=2585209 RepID=A0A8X6RKS8_TRICX|nr:uncharacterized protein TNCV_4292541 [Trichonephila clavipes]